MAYDFRAVTEADLPMLREWRTRPHVIRWWGPPEVEPAEESLADPRVAMWIVEHRGRTFAYAQDYDVHGWTPHPFSYLPPGARGIDQYIGEPDMVDRGHGSAFVRAHCDRLFAAGAPAVGTDPHPDNLRARRAYEKAGFLLTGGARETLWGTAVLMEKWRPGSRSLTPALRRAAAPASRRRAEEGFRRPTSRPGAGS